MGHTEPITQCPHHLLSLPNWRVDTVNVVYSTVHFLQDLDRLPVKKGLLYCKTKWADMVRKSLLCATLPGWILYVSCELHPSQKETHFPISPSLTHGCIMYHRHRTFLHLSKLYNNTWNITLDNTLIGICRICYWIPLKRKHHWSWEMAYILATQNIAYNILELSSCNALHNLIILEICNV